MELSSFKRRAVNQVMEENDLDLLIASLPSNVYYLSGYQSVGHGMLYRILVFALYRKGGEEIALIIPAAEIPTAKEQVDNPLLYPYGNFSFAFTDSSQEENFKAGIQEISSSPAEALDKGVKDLISTGRVGFDENRVPPGIWEKIRSNSSIEVVPAGDMLGRAKMVKHPQEIANLERAAEIAEEGIHFLLENLLPGMNEQEMASLYIKRVTELEAQPFFNVITVDSRSPFVDTINTRNETKKGSIIRIDAGCIYNNYKSDMARTAVLGNPPSRVSEYYEAILQGEEAAMDKMGPGVTAAEIFSEAVQGVRKGIPHFDRHHCGHGIGLEVYDPPLIAPDEKQKLKPGMVFCIETPYYELGWGGIQVEDPVVVTETGRRILTKRSRELIVVEPR